MRCTTSSHTIRAGERRGRSANIVLNDAIEHHDNHNHRADENNGRNHHYSCDHHDCRASYHDDHNGSPHNDSRSGPDNYISAVSPLLHPMPQAR